MARTKRLFLFLFFRRIFKTTENKHWGRGRIENKDDTRRGKKRQALWIVIVRFFFSSIFYFRSCLYLALFWKRPTRSLMPGWKSLSGFAATFVNDIIIYSKRLSARKFVLSRSCFPTAFIAQQLRWSYILGNSVGQEFLWVEPGE